MEIRPIPTIENYGCDREGNIYSLRKNKILKLCIQSHGYSSYNLSINGKTRSYGGHRLVAMTWLDAVPGKKQVNHKNGIKTDNRADNLEWVSSKENIVHARDKLKKYWGEQSITSKITEDIVRQIRASTERQQDIARKIGISYCQVNKIVNRKSWAHVE